MESQSPELLEEYVVQDGTDDNLHGQEMKQFLRATDEDRFQWIRGRGLCFHIG